MPTYFPYNEKELLERIAAGDEAAFSVLFYTYHQQLGDYIFRLTRSLATAEEIVQEVFVKLWTKKHLLKEVNNIQSYIYRLSRNHTLNSLRQLAKERAGKDAWIRDAGPLEEDPVYNEQYFRLIDEAISKLPPQQQKAWLLSRKEGLMHEEIAHEMHISRETVKRHIQLALRFIMSYVRQHAEIPCTVAGTLTVLL